MGEAQRETDAELKAVAAARSALAAERAALEAEAAELVTFAGKLQVGVVVALVWRKLQVSAKTSEICTLERSYCP